jgi:hypothetical protein
VSARVQGPARLQVLVIDRAAAWGDRGRVSGAEYRVTNLPWEIHHSQLISRYFTDKYFYCNFISFLNEKLKI